ncbi:putative uncharacterized protein [Bacteroides sp. CAG:633]|uniref:alginate export family protein n=1 Tax=Bacteroides sp. CAG:633 TaxID=1262744 RepID=UPI000337C08C|nr:putative uncharacterized protein [Bacteroides sp. CAG:633]
MRRRNLSMLIAFLFIGNVSISYAQEENNEKDKFFVSAQIRTRGEYRNGALYPRNESDLPSGFINERARLSLGYERQRLSLKFSAQHVGVWGQDALVDKNGRFILNEAWAAFEFNDYWFMQLGRQALSYDDERILGGLDWNVAGRYHDALKIGYRKNGHQLHGIFAFNQNDENVIGGTFYDSSKTKLYKNMQTLWYHYDFASTPLQFSIMAMNLGQEGGDAESRKSDTQYMQTFGTYIKYAPGQWNLSGAFYYQFGKNVSSRSVSAFMGSARASYNINKSWSVNVGTDYLSGNDKSDGTYKAFNPLYGTHHKFYGAMDYFYASDFIGGYSPGLSDTQIGVGYKVSSSVSMGMNYHYFATAVKLENLKRSLGSEIDYQLDWKIMKDVSLSLGYSVMFGTSTMDIVKGGNHNSWQDWGWISLNINPQIFCK